jgi:hypothetical protein
MNGKKYELVNPPRQVPLLVRFQVLFGGIQNQVGWLLFGFWFIVFWSVTLKSDLTIFPVDPEMTNGEVTYVKDTGSREGGGGRHSARIPIYANYYSFRASDGKEYQGIAYSTGVCLDKGDTVTIEYSKKNPSVSRIPGMRRAIFTSLTGIVVIIPIIIGIYFITSGLRNGIKAIYLLINGKVAFGILKSKVGLASKTDGQRDYKLAFEFTAENGKNYKVTAKTHTPYLLEDEGKELVLYVSSNPACAILLDSLPGSIKIDESGNFQPENLMHALLVMVLPFVSIIGHAIYAYLNFFVNGK